MNKAVTFALLRIITVSCLAGMVGGCASRPLSYNAAESRMPRLRAGYARVIFYCDQSANLTREQEFTCYLDDAEVGHLSTRQFMFADHRAGRVQVKAKTSTNPLLVPKHFALDLEPGDVRYVQLEMKFTYPVDVGLRIVEAEKGEDDVSTCVYAGVPLARSTQ